MHIFEYKLYCVPFKKIADRLEGIKQIDDRYVDKLKNSQKPVYKIGVNFQKNSVQLNLLKTRICE